MGEIDLSRCEFYKDGECFCENHYLTCVKDGSNVFYATCNDNPNCYFKQLHQAQQENEELEERFNKYIESLSGYAKLDCNILSAKDKEIEQLQSRLFKYEEALDYIIEIYKQELRCIDNKWFCPAVNNSSTKKCYEDCVYYIAKQAREGL